MMATPNAAGFVRAQQDALLREFLREPGHCFIGITGMACFAKRYGGEGSVRALPGTTLSEAFVWSRGPGTEELWVKPHDKALASQQGYRRHWEAYAGQFGGGVVTGPLNGRAQVVDHLLPETFAARQGYSHVRVLMIDHRANATVGSVVEKSMAARVVPGKSLLADWFTAAKASCFTGSFAAAVPAAQVMRALRSHIASRGPDLVLPPGEDAVAADCMQAILAWVRGR